jgi:hypothetical protein
MIWPFCTRHHIDDHLDTSVTSTKTNAPKNLITPKRPMLCMPIKNKFNHHKIGNQKQIWINHRIQNRTFKFFLTRWQKISLPTFGCHSWRTNVLGPPKKIFPFAQKQFNYLIINGHGSNNYIFFVAPQTILVTNVGN